MKKLLFILIFCINLLAEERVVTLSPSINEIVFALGMGNNVVANTKHCDFPEESKAVPKIGGYNNISLEKVLESKPTVVIGQDYDEKLNQNLNALGIKTLVYKAKTISSIKSTILDLGNYFKKEEKAKEFVANIEDQNLKDATGRIKNYCSIVGNVNPEQFKLSLSNYITDDMAVYKSLELCIFVKN